MAEFEIMLHPSPVDGDEDIFFAEIRLETRDFGVAGWIELFLQGVDESASGEQRTANARVMARMVGRWRAP